MRFQYLELSSCCLRKRICCLSCDFGCSAALLREGRRVFVQRSFFEGSAIPRCIEQLRTDLIRIWPRFFDSCAFDPSIAVSNPSSSSSTTSPNSPAVSHRFCTSRCNCACSRDRNVLWAVQFIVRRIERLTATLLVKFEWLWSWKSLSLGPQVAAYFLRKWSVIVVVSQVPIDDDRLPAILGAQSVVN